VRLERNGQCRIDPDRLNTYWEHPMHRDYRDCLTEIELAAQNWVRRMLSAAGLLVLGMQCSLAAGPPAAVPSPTGAPWVQTFSDDFTTPAGTINGWTKMLGTGSEYGLTGWGNNEAETYTANSSNLNISGGALNITAVVQNHGTNVTSARITTENLFSQTYGLFQFTARMPAGPDLWPAFWLLPKTGDWPTAGEIDVMESGLGHSLPSTSQVQGSFHSGANSTADQSQTGFYNTINDASFSTTNLNTYDLLWLPGRDPNTPGTLQWYVNGNLYETQNGGWYNPLGSADATAPFDQPFFIIMNLAVGGPNTWYTGKQSPVDGVYTMQITDVEVFAVPEPNTMVLACLSAAALTMPMLRRRRNGRP
jgi:beta-glucanase (GH16 family)